MVVITNQTAVACTPEELFDDCVDIRNEVEWNPTAVSMEKLVFPLFVVMTRRQEKANMTHLREAVERRAGVVPGRAAREMPIIYRIFRRQFAEVRALVQEAPAADATRVGVVADHLGFLLDGLHMHHTTDRGRLDLAEAARPRGARRTAGGADGGAAPVRGGEARVNRATP